MRNKKNNQSELNKPLLGELDVNSSFDEEKGDGTYTGPETSNVEELTLPLSSNEQSIDDEVKGEDLDIGLLEETTSPLFLNDEKKGGESSDIVLPTNNDAIKLLETCLSLNEGGATRSHEMNKWLFLLVIRLSHAAEYVEHIHEINRTHIEAIARKFGPTASNAFANNERNQGHFKVAYYLFLKIFNELMHQSFDNSITVLDYSSPVNRTTMSRGIDALLNETKKSFEPYEAFVAEQVDHVKIQWTELLTNLSNDRPEGSFTANIENRLDRLFANIFLEIDNASSMDVLERILLIRGNRSNWDESLHDTGYPLSCDMSFVICVSQVSALSFVGYGFMSVPRVTGPNAYDHYDIEKPSGVAIGLWCFAAILQAVTFKFIADHILSRSARTWRENLLNGLDTMRTIRTDATAAIRAKQTELFGRRNPNIVEAHRASIRRIERGEQQFEKCMEFIASFYVLQASHPDGLEKLQKPQEQLALLRYRNEPIAQQTHKEYIETASDLMGDNAWLRRQGVGFAIDDAPVYNEEEGDINSTSFGSLLSCGVMSSRMEPESSIMGELNEEKEEEDEEEADIENQCYTYPK